MCGREQQKRVIPQGNASQDVIPITGLYDMVTVMMLGVPSHWEGIHGLKPAQACCFHQNPFVVV